VIKQDRLLNNDLRSLPIQNVKSANRIATHLWSLTQTYYFPGFCVQLSDFTSENEFVDKLYTITNYLSINEVPHNCAFVKASPLYSESDGESNNQNKDKDTLRAIVWPRKSSYGK